MLVSGAMSIRSWMEDKRTREEYERLAELARETTAQPSTEAETEPGTAEPETEPYVSPINFEELMRENPDTIGWIRVPDTNIDYPIVQGEDNDFYLNHDFTARKILRAPFTWILRAREILWDAIMCCTAII